MEMDQSSSQEDENSACETKKGGERCLQDNVVNVSSPTDQTNLLQI